MAKIKHRMSHTPTHRTWISMRRRCTAKSHHQYSEYGGRGIVICDRWNDFLLFLEDMGCRPDGHTIDRIDNDGPYSPENCRWALPVVQINNRRNTSTLTYRGEKMSLADWSARTGIPRKTLAMRFHQRWSAQKILETPHKPRQAPRKRSEIPPPSRRNRRYSLTLDGVTKSAAQWARDLGIKYDTIKHRIYGGLSDREVLAKS
jgi:hypothetical protein